MSASGVASRATRMVQAFARPREPAVLLGNRKEPDEVARWTMQSVSVPDGYVAALVAEGHDWRLRSFALE